MPYFALYPEARNPFRDLMSLVGDAPALTHALTATGALHYAILYYEKFSPDPWSSDDTSNATPMSLQELESSVRNSVTRRPSSKIYEHFLSYKQRALSQLSLDICNPEKQSEYGTVAATVILALLDAIESGSGAWKYHLEGAKNLLKSREHSFPADNTRDIMDWLDAFAIDGCTM